MILFNTSPRTFHEAPDGAGAPPVPATPAPQGQQAAPLPPPPSDGGKATVDVGKLYQRIHALEGEKIQYMERVASMEKSHAEALQTNAEKISAYDELQSKYTSAEETLGKYREFAQGHLKNKFEGLDEVTRGEMEFDALKETPLKAFEIIDQRAATIAKLKEQMAGEKNKENKGLEGNPDKGQTSKDIAKRYADGEITEAEFLAERYPNQFGTFNPGE